MPHSSDHISQTTPAAASPKGSGAALEQARRDKLNRLRSLGIDPWGKRFDGVVPIATVRATGESLALPTEKPAPAVTGDTQTVAAPSPPSSDTNAIPSSNEEGPTVRVAGRIMLLRNAGSLVFLDVADRTGRIQIMLGKKQVGPDIWKVVDCLDLGDIIGVDGRLGYSKKENSRSLRSISSFSQNRSRRPPISFTVSWMPT